MARSAGSPRPAGKKKVHLLAAITHGTGLVISQDKVARAGKANEVTHFKPLLEPLPLDGVVITADAMQTTRENARWIVEDKHAQYLLPVLGNQPGTYAALDALDWESTPVAAATSEISRGRIETRTIRVLPAPAGPGFPHASGAILIERYVTVKKNGRWAMRNCEAVLYVTSLDTSQATPADLLALHPRPLDDRAPALAPRHGLAGGQIHPPHRKRPPGDVRPHQPRHHPIPATRSNQNHGGNTPQRPEPAPPAPATRPLARLNTPHDFDESLVSVQDRRAADRTWRSLALMYFRALVSRVGDVVAQGTEQLA